MGQTITTAMLVIASLIATLALINAVLPAMGKSASALATANGEAAKRIKTDIDVIYATGNTSGTITIWVKNVGTQVIKAVQSSDIIIIKPNSVSRLPYVSGCSSECWDYTLEDSATAWTTTVTVKFTVKTSVDAGSYSVSVAAPNGVTAVKDFSV